MVKLNRIYTRTGDDGTTGLVDGSRVEKHDARLHAIGEVDEANSAIGVALAVPGLSAPVQAMLTRIQNDLFDLGADLATPGGGDGPQASALRVVSEQVQWLEDMIDRLNEDLAPLTSFILPGGTPAAAALHLARAIARRAERATVAAAADRIINPYALRYLNRLSDLLFVLARTVNQNGSGDVLWQPGASRAT
jgi:cob(I)alamin adenosyltransferase